ncbi:cysteine desulfurase [Marine Group I thaumarchaeote]|uniref:cysteine desulfurase n=1 Tax=Marine Group I thaumarchaeote TaxID=2511932 RepID=A0A7K4N2V6_9ARCH|nr:cysteine desulfurase [Marine Group I thaumarchaeote]
MIYLDNAASTAVHPEVVKEMLPYFDVQYGNPSSIHQFGRKAKNAIQKARKQVAALIDAEPDEILFTSGGTESNNIILYGITKLQGSHLDQNHIITSSIEHEAILQPCKKFENIGIKITYLPVDEHGIVNPDDITNSINPHTVLVSIMFANNEVGTIQPIKEISEVCKKYDVLFHTDAVQAVGKVPINVKELGVDALSVSSHKINGPKGVGALFIKKGVIVAPQILGGGQENGMRSGTENVASIVGFGKACEIAKERLNENISHFQTLHSSMLSKIVKEISHVKLNGHPGKRIFNNIHLTFLGVQGEDLIIKLDEHGIAASTGSACSVHTQKASHVLKAMGFNHEQITGSLRMSFGYMNTLNEVEQTVEVLKKVVSELRNISPYKTKYNF